MALSLRKPLRMVATSLSNLKCLEWGFLRGVLIRLRDRSRRELVKALFVDNED